MPLEVLCYQQNSIYLNFYCKTFLQLLETVVKAVCFLADVNES